MLTREAIYGSAHRYTWTLTAADATGESTTNPGAADRTVQFVGTFGGATVKLYGSNNEIDWNVLHDFNGAELSFTSGAIALIAENPAYIRPEATGTSGTTDVQAIMVSRSR